MRSYAATGLSNRSTQLESTAEGRLAKQCLTSTLDLRLTLDLVLKLADMNVTNSYNVGSTNLSSTGLQVGTT